MGRSPGHWLMGLQLCWLFVGLVAVAAFRLALLGWRPAVQLAALSLAGLVLIGFVGLLALLINLRARKNGGGRSTAMAVVLSLPALAVTAVLGFKAARTPLIHDITTDTTSPPPLMAARSLRASGDNSPEYPGAAAADQQHSAYADIVPLELVLSPEAAFARSLNVARQLGLTVVARHPDRGLIEATDRSLMFGFTDDIVIRITRSAGGSRIDLRSASRAGVSDLGVNAKRIRAFLQAMKAPSKE